MKTNQVVCRCEICFDLPVSESNVSLKRPSGEFCQKPNIRRDYFKDGSCDYNNENPYTVLMDQMQPAFLTPVTDVQFHFCGWHHSCSLARSCGDTLTFLCFSVTENTLHGKLNAV